MFAIVSGVWAPQVAHMVREVRHSVPITLCGQKRPEAVVAEATPKGSFLCAACWVEVQREAAL